MERLSKNVLKHEGCKVITSMYQIPEHRRFAQELRICYRNFQISRWSQWWDLAQQREENRREDGGLAGI